MEVGFAEPPAPNLPDPDYERAVDELDCEVGIRQACCLLDSKVTQVLRCKSEVIAEEARQAINDVVDDVKKVHNF